MKRFRWPGGRAQGSEAATLEAAPEILETGTNSAGAGDRAAPRLSPADAARLPASRPVEEAISTVASPETAEAALGRVRAEQQRLVRANLALLRQLRPGAAVQWATNDVRSVVDADYAALVLLDGADGVTGTFAQSGLARGVHARIPADRPEAHGFLGTALHAGRPVRLRDVRLHPAFTGFPAGHPEMTSFVSAPLVRRHQVIGLLFAANKRGAEEFSEEDERFVTRVASELVRSRLLSAEPRPPELMERIEAATRSLRREMEATRSFLASISHELRGSIGGIMVSAELLTDPAFSALEKEQMRTVGGRIHTVASNLLDLVDNLLDLGRLEAGRLDVRLRPVELPTVVEDVTGVIAPLAEAAGVTVEWPRLAGLPRVVADPIRLRQVLVNLFTNAVKFTPAGGRAWLECSATSAGVQVAVCDTGRGIAPSETERIFEPFERAVGAHVPGVGLGLAICRRIVELHGSRLEVSSEPGVGSRFWFCLRRSREPLPPRLLRPPVGVHAVAEVGGEPATVLLVEDDPVSRESTSDVLGGTGYRVRSVGTRAAALEAFAMSPTDVVILDVHLPDGSGLEIVDALRAAAPHPLAIVALSADRIGDTAALALASGCDRFGLKPIPARDLLGLIVEAVQERRAYAPINTTPRED